METGTKYVVHSKHDGNQLRFSFSTLEEAEIYAANTDNVIGIYKVITEVV